MAFNCTHDREIILAIATKPLEYRDNRSGSSENIIWCYYYTDFPLAKINRGSIEDYWHIPLYGSNCFAIFRNFALFRGGYKDRDCFYLIKLGKNHRATIEKKIQPANLKNIEYVCSRGDTIFCLCKQNIYAISVYEAMYVN